MTKALSWRGGSGASSQTKEHIDAAQREKRGQLVKLRYDGSPFDHISELRDHWKHFKKVGMRED